jgi:hypothetical protein
MSSEYGEGSNLDRNTLQVAGNRQGVMLYTPRQERENRYGCPQAGTPSSRDSCYEIWCAAFI